jgi:ketosteroid isomerase-like protein
MKADSDIERNKDLVRRFFAAIEHGDLRVFDEIVAEDYEDHLAGQTPGRETLKRYFAGLRSAFADLSLPITNIVAEGNLVAVLNMFAARTREILADRTMPNQVSQQIYSRGNRIGSGAKFGFQREDQPKRARHEQCDRQNQNGPL